MLSILAGVPGKLKAISDYLTTNWSTARAAKVDNLDAAMTTRAAAITALSTAQWTNTRAALLDNLSNLVAISRPKAAGITAGHTGYTTGSASFVTAVTYTGSGYLQLVLQTNASGAAGSVRLTLDGVVVYNGTVAAGTIPLALVGVANPADGTVFSYEAIPFSTSLLVEHLSSSGSVTTTVKFAKVT